MYCLLNKITITGLLAQFNAAHNKEESILCMATDKRNEYLFTGEIFKYLKLVKVRVSFANCRKYRKILCCSYGRSDKFYMSLALFQISIQIDISGGMNIPNTCECTPTNQSLMLKKNNCRSFVVVRSSPDRREI